MKIKVYPPRVKWLGKAIPMVFAGMNTIHNDGSVDLGIVLTNYCTAACAHCYNNSNKWGASHLPYNALAKIIDSASILDSPVARIGFSGGEPFEYARLQELVKLAKNRGISTCCITGLANVTNDQIREIAAAGLEKLVVSTDEFHLKFVPIHRVCEAINLACSLIDKVVVQISSAGGDEKAHNILDILIDNTPDKVDIQVRTVYSVGRGTKLNDAKALDECSRVDDETSSIRNSFSINFDGLIYKGCTLSGFGSEKSIGTLLN